MQVDIDFNDYNSIHTTIESLPQIALSDYDDNVHFNIEYTCGRYLNTDCYITLVSIINELKVLGKNVTVFFDTDQDCDTVKYASRINFFNLIGVNYAEKFKRRSTIGSLLEITHIPIGTHGLNGVEGIFESNFNLKEEELEALIFVFNELICNTTLHSDSTNGGYIYSQKFPSKSKLDILIVDSGIGIKNSLNKSYENLSNEDALKSSLDFGITCGNGQGHGLYFISELLIRNLGEMFLISGDNSICIFNGKSFVNRNHFWNGTILKCSFNLKNELPLNELLKEKKYS